MDLGWWLEQFGDQNAILLSGIITGLIFGVSAQRSRFCLRAATVSFARGRFDDRMAVWLLCFSTALCWTQAFALRGYADLDESRMLANAGSLSGAIIGGLLFGSGMVLARGCSGRLLVLAASGNLRALLSGLVFVVVAQMAFEGVLAPLRTQLAAWWTTGASNIQTLDWLGLPGPTGLVLGLAFAVLALIVAQRAKVGAARLVFACGVGFAVGLGWLLTSSLASQSFEPVTIQSLTFSGPSADSLMYLLGGGAIPGFGVGVVLGVFVGAGGSAWLANEWRLEGFEGAASMRRYLTGAAFMGFGAMLAGGCAIGAGVTGTSTMALTMWTALTSMWIGASLTDMLVDQHRSELAIGSTGVGTA